MSEPTQTSQNPLLRTKLHCPVVPKDFLCRPRLHDLMNLGLELPLTLVSAPAGYGKSLLVSDWVASQSVPCAWLSLDASDSAVDLFVDYLLAAVETVVPGACPQTRRMAQAPEPPPTAVLANSLSNELDALTSPVVLVLDDYHRIRGESEEVHELMRSCWCTRQGACVLCGDAPILPWVRSGRTSRRPERPCSGGWRSQP